MREAELHVQFWLELKRCMKTSTRNADGEDCAHKVSGGIEDKRSLV